MFARCTICLERFGELNPPMSTVCGHLYCALCAGRHFVARGALCAACRGGPCKLDQLIKLFPDYENERASTSSRRARPHPNPQRLRWPNSASPPPPAQPPAAPDYPRPLYFYHEHDPYYEFNNFSPHPIEWEGHTYPTAEHLFQAHKFITDRPDLVTRIRHLHSPREALEVARRMRRLQRSDWFDVNVSIMDNILHAKFTQHPELKASLLGTGNREIIEDSPVDSFWGCGRDRQGRNELGKALMRLRDGLRQPTRDDTTRSTRARWV
ncbi:hypothetical protein FOMPIDRAFT_1055529 [Fomitopsis schrenkii]|uniref:RING-type domain-containing protein n=1 Tax=Fomitopsis schrenkii TaxID=2126942 RepID=S8DK20_FOMSC|nr:hypothetical protein FOMPIDRAFT_1055529 [Fomitopsis schrenkii]